MAKNDAEQLNEPIKERDPLPESFGSLEEAGEFWDTHSSADYEEYFSDELIELEYTGERALKFRIEYSIAQSVTDVAKKRGISPETLLNLWIQEKLTSLAS